MGIWWRSKSTIAQTWIVVGVIVLGLIVAGAVSGGNKTASPVRPSVPVAATICGSSTHLVGGVCVANAVAPSVRKVYITRTVTVTTTVTTPAPAPASPTAPPQTPPATGSIESVGSSDHSTDAQFCQTHQCIGAFTTEGGTIVQCVDGTYSHAGGISGACSRHGGEQ